ncbi:MAG TPA: YdcF family protein [Candidatus Angelobacter sp.]|nr:YdcF family protein [Candidatus Angelobacter sp.]
MNEDLATTPPSKRPHRESQGAAVQSSREKSGLSKDKPKRRPFFGLVKRKEKWTLTWRGRFLAFITVVLLGWAFVLWIHGFLAITQRVDTDYLVIEGWIPNYALQESIVEFKSKPYKMIFTVGSDPLSGVNVEEGDSIAMESFKRLKWMGVKPELIQPVPAHIKYRNRTFQSALALRRWVEENHVPVKSFNLVTVGPHARRSRLLFEEAFGEGVKVGVISVENREYDPKHWWKYSEGVKETIGESIGYIYARFFFRPTETDS